MGFAVACPFCRQVYEDISKSYVGWGMECTQCHQVFTIPPPPDSSTNLETSGQARRNPKKLHPTLSPLAQPFVSPSAPSTPSSAPPSALPPVPPSAPPSTTPSTGVPGRVSMPWLSDSPLQSPASVSPASPSPGQEVRITPLWNTDSPTPSSPMFTESSNVAASLEDFPNLPNVSLENNLQRMNNPVSSGRRRFRRKPWYVQPAAVLIAGTAFAMLVVIATVVIVSRESDAPSPSAIVAEPELGANADIIHKDQTEGGHMSPSI